LSGTVSISVVLDADPRNVGRAREVLRDALQRSGAVDLVDSGTLAV
jgi:hypothetical protein